MYKFIYAQISSTYHGLVRTDVYCEEEKNHGIEEVNVIVNENFILLSLFLFLRNPTLFNLSTVMQK